MEEKYRFTYLNPNEKFIPIEIYIVDEETFFLYLGAMIEIVEASKVPLNSAQKLFIVRNFASLLSDYPIRINETDE